MSTVRDLEVGAELTDVNAVLVEAQATHQRALEEGWPVDTRKIMWNSVMRAGEHYRLGVQDSGQRSVQVDVLTLDGQAVRLEAKPTQPQFVTWRGREDSLALLRYDEETRRCLLEAFTEPQTPHEATVVTEQLTLGALWKVMYQDCPERNPHFIRDQTSGYQPDEFTD